MSHHTEIDIPSSRAGAWGTSMIRTHLPIAVGAGLTWLAARGLGVDPEAQTHLILGLSALGAVAWYGILRIIEPHLPAWARFFLFGSTKSPLYPPAPLVVESRAMIDPDTNHVIEVYTITDLPPGAKVITHE
jgi:hypothetical protein